MNSLRDRLNPPPKHDPETIFERYVFDDPERELSYVSPLLLLKGTCGVAVFVDGRPKCEGQTVVALWHGTPGIDQRIHHLDQPSRLVSAELAGFFALRLEERAGILAPDASDPIALTHTEGRGVRDHAHALMYLSPDRGDGARLYQPEWLGHEAPERALDVMRLTSSEINFLDRHLGHLVARLS